MLSKFWCNLNRGEKMLYGGVWVVILILFIHAGLALYFFRFYLTPSVVHTTTTFPIVNRVVKQGEPVITIVERCSRGSYNAVVTRKAIDTIIYSIPGQTVFFVKGCVKEKRAIPDISQALDPGTYYLKNHFEIPIHWLWFSRTDAYDTETEKFTIVK